MNISVEVRDQIDKWSARLRTNAAWNNTPLIELVDATFADERDKGDDDDEVTVGSLSLFHLSDILSNSLGNCPDLDGRPNFVSNSEEHNGSAHNARTCQCH